MIAAAPARFLRWGIGDALSKVFEAGACQTAGGGGGDHGGVDQHHVRIPRQGPHLDEIVLGVVHHRAPAGGRVAGGDGRYDDQGRSQRDGDAFSRIDGAAAAGRHHHVRRPGLGREGGDGLAGDEASERQERRGRPQRRLEAPAQALQGVGVDDRRRREAQLRHQPGQLIQHAGALDIGPRRTEGAEGRAGQDGGSVRRRLRTPISVVRPSGPRTARP